MTNIMDIAKEYNRVDRIRYHMGKVKELVDRLDSNIELGVNKEVIEAVNESSESLQKYASMLLAMVKDNAKRMTSQSMSVIDIVKDYMTAKKAVKDYWKVTEYVEFLISCNSNLDYALTKSVSEAKSVLEEYVRILETLLTDTTIEWPPRREIIYRMEDK